jgi:transcriptional regulator with XRE-family HTH domain
MTRTQRAKLSDEIRAAIDRCGMSRYAICKQTGIAEGNMSRFMAGKAGLELSTLDALADLLDLHIAEGRGKARRTTRKGKVTK